MGDEPALNKCVIKQWKVWIAADGMGVLQTMEKQSEDQMESKREVKRKHCESHPFPWKCTPGVLLINGV
jgi:hypothetical protein